MSGNGGKIFFGIMLVIAIILAATSFSIPALVKFFSSGEKASLVLEVTAPSQALYGEKVEVNVYVKSTGPTPANPRTKTVVTLGEDKILDETKAVQPNQASESFRVRLVQKGFLQSFVSSAVIDVVASADNAEPVSKKLSLQIWRPSAKLTFELPYIASWNPLEPKNRLKAGTNVFKKVSTEYTGKEKGPFNVAVAVVLDSQYKGYFVMNDRLAKKYESQNSIVWVLGKWTISTASPVWNLDPLDSTLFTASTGGADSVAIKIKVTLMLDLGQDQYLSLFEEESSVIIVK